MRIFASRAERQANLRDWRRWALAVLTTIVGLGLAAYGHAIRVALGV